MQGPTPPALVAKHTSAAKPGRCGHFRQVRVRVIVMASLGIFARSQADDPSATLYLTGALVGARARVIITSDISCYEVTKISIGVRAKQQSGTH